ncbi:methyltransferase domain-containing protein [Coniochaeta sp. 2T2.1]|nr:methyltransferase domain-containing protein [Coniochaeta sp. 2T2.1]
MRPEKDLPYSDEFSSTEEYVQSLLHFADNSDIFRILCGGVHILDFFTNEPGLFYTTLPEEWQRFLVSCEPMVLLDLLMRDDLDTVATGPDGPPDSLLQYAKDIRRLSLRRSFSPAKNTKLSRQVILGMKQKKIHEVTCFSNYVDTLADDVASMTGRELTHFVDFGSGQNYLGRALASEPYNRHIVAVEGRVNNIEGAKYLDLQAGIAKPEKVLRNKKLYMQALARVDPAQQNDPEALKKAVEGLGFSAEDIAATELRPTRELQTTYLPEEGKGSINYIIGRLENGDLTDVVSQLQTDEQASKEDLRMMAISIHSCGNLSHFGIRSLVLNPTIHAVAIVGCCYNLMTEKLGPPSYKPPFHRPSLQPINGRVVRESERRDPQGFPMSERLSEYDGHGIRLNITARMMACQAPQNWTEKESEDFFTRHFYRAVLQKIFLDRGVIGIVKTDEDESTPFNTSTNPVIIGSLRKSCYTSFSAYVRGAVSKITTGIHSTQADLVRERMGAITDEEIAEYEGGYQPRKREISVVWSLMAFSACVAESLIVVDRWLFLKEQGEVVRDAWVESVFDYRESPRNLVVVGIKR